MHSLIRLGVLAASFVVFCVPQMGLTQNLLEPLPLLDSVSFEELQQLAGRLDAQTAGLLEIFKEKKEQAKQRRLALETQLAEAKLDSAMSKTQVDSLSKALKRAKSAEKTHSKENDKAERTAASAHALLEMDSLNLRKNLPISWKQSFVLMSLVFPPEFLNPQISESPNPEPPNPQSPNPQSSEPPNPKSPNPSRRFARYNPANDVMLHPPEAPCVVAASSRDEFSGEISREMARGELFRFTNPMLREYLQGKTHVICEAALSSTGPNVTLSLVFIINDPNARKAFGRLEKNGQALLKFMDGSSFILQNSISSDGSFNPETEATIYRAQYALSPDVMKKLRRIELDKLRVAWNNGFDEYDVQQVDLLMRQANCLSKR